MEPPKVSVDAVLVKSEQLPADVSQPVRGYDFSEGVDLGKLLDSFATTGFQATHFAQGVAEVDRMLRCKAEGLPADVLAERRRVEEAAGEPLNPCGRPLSNCTIFLAYTSNMVSCGVRESIRYLAQNNLVDVLVTSAGGIEEDLMKCLAPHYIGDFHKWRGAELRRSGINRIGNLLVPNDNYCKLEAWLMPLLDQMLLEQTRDNVNWTPSKLIARLGKEIGHPDSIYYWAQKNNIPVFCPGMTDGALGDVIYFHSFRNPGLRVDICEDIRLINLQAVHARHTGMIILGGGVIKHHTCNANLMRNGAEFAVFVNTGQEFDGSDSGARPDEAVSWGKVKLDSSPVKIYADASLIFPLLVARSFATFAERLQSPKTEAKAD